MAWPGLLWISRAPLIFTRTPRLPAHTQAGAGSGRVQVWTDVGQGWDVVSVAGLCRGDACDARPGGGGGAGRGGCGRPALHALVSDLWTKDDGTRNSRAAQDGPVHFQSLNAGVSMRRAVVTAPGTCHQL